MDNAAIKILDEKSHTPTDTIVYQRADIGTTVLLRCEYTKSQRDIDNFRSLEWSKKNQKLHQGDKLISNDSRLNLFKEFNLEIRNVKYENEGKYSCSFVGPTEWLKQYPPIRYSLMVLKSQESSSIEWHQGDEVLFASKSYIFGHEIPKNLKILEGYSIEIQNIGPEDNGTEYFCDKSFAPFDGVLKNERHILEVFDALDNKTENPCSPSPCGVNSECRLRTNHIVCSCRKSHKGDPPNCTRDCDPDCKPHLACTSDYCKSVCQKSCTTNAECVVHNFKFHCFCKGFHFGDGYYICSTREVPGSEYSKPSFKTTNHTYEKNIGSNVILPCEVFDADYVTPLLQWEKSPKNSYFSISLDVHQPRMQLYSQYNLQLSNVSKQDAGYYFCTLNDFEKADEKYMKFLRRIYKVELPGLTYNNSEPLGQDFQPHHTINAKLYDTIILPCEGINGGEMDWSADLYNGIQWVGYAEAEKYSHISTGPEGTPVPRIKLIKGYNLEIQNLQREDEGIYSCVMLGALTITSKTSRIFHKLKISDSRLDHDPCLGNRCGENSDCYPKNNEPQCSCRKNYGQAPPYCTKNCIHHRDCHWAACVNEDCKTLCEQSCGANAQCRMQNYTYACFCENGFSGEPDKGCLPDPVSEICGAQCLALAIGGPILLLMLLVGVIILIIKKRGRAQRRRSLPPIPPFPDKKWEFPRQRLSVQDVIGEGHFGRVLKAQASGLQEQKDTTTVAVKTLKENATGSHRDDLISECQLLKELDHPNVIRFLGVCSKDDPIYIILEFAENGSLSCYLRNKRLEISEQIPDSTDLPVHPLLPPKNILSFARQIASGMSYIADMKLVHRDLATRNVLLTKELVCKISDFGLTRDVYTDGEYFKTSDGGVPIKWMAMESILDGTYTTKTDVWSYGVLLWELITFGKIPYPGMHNIEIFSFLKQGKRMEKPEGCSDKFYEIMSSCWKENPSDRPEFPDLVEKLEEMLSSGTFYLECTDEEKYGKIN